ncbi:LEA type 2 family protein [Tenacibaculum maritimum]|uniref:LEA type 2 family protein n=1 Tax=Tenacibaculum maritimum TaxID=107401 RepID=UPI00388E288B
MRKFVYFLGILLCFLNCSVREKPIFLKVDAIKVVAIKSDTIHLKASAFFQNPNDIGGTISTDEIKVMVNEAEIAKVSSEKFKVPARKEFEVPLQVKIPTKKVFETKKNGILGGVINALLSNSLKVRFKGNLKYALFGFSRIYAIDQTEEIKLQ